MTAQPDKHSVENLEPSSFPRPVRGGENHVESLGRLLDRIMFDHKDEKAANKALSVMGVIDPETSPDDPEPIEPPSPVPDGDDFGTRGAPPGETK